MKEQLLEVLKDYIKDVAYFVPLLDKKSRELKQLHIHFMVHQVFI
jgi:hypothetical protein